MPSRPQNEAVPPTTGSATAALQSCRIGLQACALSPPIRSRNTNVVEHRRSFASTTALLFAAACSPARAAVAEAPTSTCQASDPRVGSKAFAFSLPGTEGETVVFSGHDKATLLVFWASWCKPCADELPAYEAMMRRIGSSRAALILVSTDEDKQTATDALECFGVDHPSGYSGESEFNRYLTPTLPWTILVDDERTIRSVHRGFEPRCIDEIEQSIVALSRER